MSIKISKDGQEYGPYSISESRTMVLEGTVAPTDWAWYEGATDWVQLKEVPGFAELHDTASAPNPYPSAPAVPSREAQQPGANEETLWNGSPSQLLNVGTAFKWAFFLMVLGGIAKFSASVSETADFLPWVYLAFGLSIPACLMNLLLRYLALRATRYTVTNQRVKVVRGLLSRDVQEVELFRVKDTAAHQSILLRLFGLGSVTIYSGDRNNPVLMLRAIPNAIELREKLRGEVLLLRQRYSVREMEVM